MWEGRQGGRGGGEREVGAGGVVEKGRKGGAMGIKGRWRQRVKGGEVNEGEVEER